MYKKIANSLRRKQRLFLTGLSMGIADLIPGVSGGTIAFLFGIYDELLYSIKLFSGTIPKLLLKGQFKQALKLAPIPFLLPLALGMLTAIFGFVRIVTYLLDNHAVYVWSLFFGLVLGSAYIVSKRIKSWTPSRITTLIIGLAATYLVVGLPAMSAAPTPLVLFGTGAIAICAMILPGISGSLIMVILGQYKNVIAAVSDQNYMQLIYFALGAITGLAIFSRLLSWLLRNHHSLVIAFLIGMMLGSLRKVWPWQIEQSPGMLVNTLPQLDWQLLASLALIIIGFILVWKLEKLGLAREHNDIDSKQFTREVKTQHD